MAGRTNTPRDAHGIYESACVELADELGWKRREVWQMWQWFAGCREFEQRYPRAAAEAFALDDVRQVYDKRGSLAS